MTFMIDFENFYFKITYRADFECVQIELAKNYGVNEWREDLRKVMMKAGLENNPTVFLFSDTQVSFFRLKVTTSWNKFVSVLKGT